MKKSTDRTNFLQKHKSRLVCCGVFFSFLLSLYFSDAFVFRKIDGSIHHYENKVSNLLLDNEVVAYWDFDELKIKELIKKGNVFTEGTVLVKGRYGMARQFLSERNGSVRTSTSLAFLSGNYAFSCWLSIPDTTLNQRIFKYMHIENNFLVFDIPAQKNVLKTKISDGSRFMFVAVVVDDDAGDARLYIDGDLRSTIKIGKVGIKHNLVVFGQIEGFNKPNFALDDVVFWRRCLSKKEIDTVYTSKKSVRERIAGGAVKRLHALNMVRSVCHNIVSSFDLFNPWFHETTALSDDVNRFDLILSKKDLKTFRAFENHRISNGINEYNTSDRRTIGLLLNGKTVSARMEMICNGNGRISARKSFSIDRNDSGTGNHSERFLFEPPEWHDFMPMLLTRKLAMDIGAHSVSPELCSVTVNGVFDGVYFVEVIGDRLDHYSLTVPGQWQKCLRSFPYTRSEILEEYDAMVKNILPIILADRKNPMNSQELRYMVKLQRQKVIKLLDGKSAEAGYELTEQVRDYMTENVLLGDNPASDYIINDLDFSCHEIRGVNVSYKSMTPDILSDEGKVMRNFAEMSEARLLLTMRYGIETLTNTLKFLVIPETSKMPVLNLNVGGTINADLRVSCGVCLIDDAGTLQHEWMPGRIKFRGNTSLVKAQKKYFSIKLNSAHNLFGSNDSRYLSLTSCYRDPTFMREKLSYDLFRSFSEPGAPRYAPQCRFVELVINNKYWGVYTLSERVDADALGWGKHDCCGQNRQNVLYKAQGAHAGFKSIHRSAYVQKVPDCRRCLYWEPYDQLMTFIAKSDRSTFANGIEAIVDVDNLIDFEILLNLANNQEGVRYNLFLARSSAPDSRFFIIPWDYDMTFRKNGWVSNNLLNRLRHDLPGYSCRLQSRWKNLRERQLSTESLMERIDGMSKALAEASIRNFHRWDFNEDKEHKKVVESMRVWLQDRLKWMDLYMDKIKPAVVDTKPVERMVSR